MKKLWLLFVLSFVLFACDEEKKDATASKKMSSSVLPESGGEPGEIVIIVNRKKYDAELGDAVKEVFQEYIDGMTRREPMFTIRVVEPFEFNRIFKIARNLVYITSFEGNSAADKWLQGIYSDESKQRIFAEPSRYMQTSNDQYAKGQNVMQLFGKDDATLIQNLKENKELIQNYFNIAERNRLAKEIRMSTESRSILQKVNKEHNFNIKIPAGYELASLEEDFVWVRTLPPVGASKNLIVYYKDYQDRSEFEHANVIKLRNEVGQKYVFGDPENDESFMTTEEVYVQPVFRDINFDGKYTVETKGVWKTNNLSVGGTFVSYTFVDEERNRLYYVEGFVIHPNEDHRELIREMESLLTTFRAS